MTLTKGTEPTPTHSQLLASALRRSVLQRPVTGDWPAITCADCHETFDSGYSFIRHFEKQTADLACASRSLLALAGFKNTERGWSAA